MSEWKHITCLLEKKSRSDVDNQSKYYEVLHGKYITFITLVSIMFYEMCLNF